MTARATQGRVCSRRRRWPPAWRWPRAEVAASTATRGGGGGDGEGSSSDGAVELNMLIASSGDAETAAVQDAVKKWGTSPATP